jgi:hypothetical protein
MHRFALVLLVAGCATGASTLEPGEIDAAATDARRSDDASDEVSDAAPGDGAASLDAASTDAASIDAASIDASPVDSGIDAPPGGPTDTCAQAIDLTSQAGGNGVTVNGTTIGYANDISMATTCTGYTTTAPDAIYRVDLAAGQTLTVTGDPTTTWDLSLLVVAPCSLTPACLVGDDNGFAGTTETVTYTATAAISAYVIVDGYTTNIVGPYALTVRVQ